MHFENIKAVDEYIENELAQNFKDLEDNGFEMDTYKLQDAMTDIAMTFADTVAGLKYIKPKGSEVKNEAS